jgi:hypothetical protein
MSLLRRTYKVQDIQGPPTELSGIPGRSDLREILNEHKTATKAINFIEQTRSLAISGRGVEDDLSIHLTWRADNTVLQSFAYLYPQVLYSY